jgi:hypothetical protein
VRVAQQLVDGVGGGRAALQGEQIALDPLEPLVRLLTRDVEDLGPSGDTASSTAPTLTTPTRAPSISAAPSR